MWYKLSQQNVLSLFERIWEDALDKSYVFEDYYMKLKDALNSQNNEYIHSVMDEILPYISYNKYNSLWIRHMDDFKGL